MNTDEQFNASPIIIPIDQKHISLYSCIRLDALKHNPGFFLAKHDEESRFTNDEWRTILETPGRITLIAHSGPVLESAEQWVGLGNLLKPPFLDSIGARVPSAFLGLQPEETAIYLLEGLWIRPEYRGKGLAAKILKVAVETIRQDHTEIKKKRILALSVDSPNIAAKRVYERFGFTNRGIWSDYVVQDEWMVFEV